MKGAISSGLVVLLQLPALVEVVLTGLGCDGRVDGARTRTVEGCLKVDVAWCLPGHGAGKAGGGASPCVRAHFTSSVNVFKGSEEKDERGREKGST